MTLRSVCATLAVAGLAVVIAGPAWAGEEKESARHEVRVEMHAAGPGQEPQVRMWINGEEVEPGEPIQLGEGKARVRIQAVPAGRHRGEETGEAPHGQPALGVHIVPLGDDLAREVGVESGAAVIGVAEGSPAQHAGLREGDVITAIDGQEVHSPQELVERISRCRPGQRVRIRWHRARARIEATITLTGRDELTIEEGQRPDQREREQQEREREARDREEREREKAEEPEHDERRAGFLGILAAPLNDDIREIAGTDEGVLINSLTDDSPAAKAGLRPGDVIVRIGDADVHAVEELVDRLRDREAGQRVHVVYYRMGKRRETEVTLGRRPGAEGEHAEKEGFPLFDDLFGGEVPNLRDYLKRLQPEMEDWARKFRQQRREQPERQEMPGPARPNASRTARATNSARSWSASSASNAVSNGSRTGSRNNAASSASGRRCPAPASSADTDAGARKPRCTVGPTTRCAERTSRRRQVGGLAHQRSWRRLYRVPDAGRRLLS